MMTLGFMEGEKMALQKYVENQETSLDEINKVLQQVFFVYLIVFSILINVQF